MNTLSQKTPKPLTDLQEASSSIEQSFDLVAVQEATKLAETLGDSAAIIKNHRLLADYYFEKEDYAKSLETLESLLDQPVLIDSAAKADILLRIVKACAPIEETRKILRYASEALRYFEAQNDPDHQIELHDYLAESFTRFCSYHEALEHYIAQLELLKAQGRSDSRPYVGIGWVTCQLGDYDKALAYLEEGLRLARKETDPFAQARCVGNIANVYGYMNKPKLSLDFHHQAVKLVEEKGDFRKAMTGYGNIGHTYFELGDTAKARFYYEKTLRQLKKTPYKSLEGWVLIRLGETLIKEGEIKADSFILEGLEKTKEVGSFEGVENGHQILFEHYESQGHFDKALEHHKAYAELAIKQLKDMNENRTQALSVKFEVERLQQEQEIYHLKNIELARAVEQLEELSTRDSLTSLYNRRYLDTHLNSVFNEASLAKEPLSVILADIDNFKHINDQFSHAIGDEVIKTVAQIFKVSILGVDIAARFGGEEFVIVCNGTKLEQAKTVAERLRKNVEGYDWSSIQPDLVVTISLGVCADMTLGNYEKMLAVADKALYQAKRTGKNKVCT